MSFSVPASPKGGPPQSPPPPGARSQAGSPEPRTSVLGTPGSPAGAPPPSPGKSHLGRAAASLLRKMPSDVSLRGAALAADQVGLPCGTCARGRRLRAPPAAWPHIARQLAAACRAHSRARAALHALAPARPRSPRTVQRSEAGGASTSGSGGGGSSDNIKVVVRLRPMTGAEAGKGATNVVQVADDCSSMKVRAGEREAAGSCCTSRSHGWRMRSSGHVHAAAAMVHGSRPPMHACMHACMRRLTCAIWARLRPRTVRAPRQVIVPGPSGAALQREFAFHACLGPDTSQADVMALCGIQQLLDAALAGYHVTIFAYGQTGRAARARALRTPPGFGARQRTCDACMASSPTPCGGRHAARTPPAQRPPAAGRLSSRPPLMMSPAQARGRRTP